MDLASLLAGSVQPQMPVGVHPDSILAGALASHDPAQQPGYNPLATKRMLPPALESALAQDTANAKAEPVTGLGRTAEGQRDAMLDRFSTASIDPATRRVTRTSFGPQSDTLVQRGAANSMNDIAEGRFRGEYDPRTQTAFFSTKAPTTTLLHETEHGVTDMAARDLANNVNNTSDRLPFVQQMAALAKSGQYGQGANPPAWRSALGMGLDELNSHMLERGPESDARWAGAKNFLFDNPTNAYRRQAYGDLIGGVSPGVGLGYRAIGKIPAAADALGLTKLEPAMAGIGPTARGVAGAIGDVAGSLGSAGGRLYDALGGR